MENKKRPPGWGFLLGLAIITDALQFCLSLFFMAASFLSSVVPIVGPLFMWMLSWSINFLLSVFANAAIFVWRGHHNLKSNHMRLAVVAISEFLPLNFIPTWTIYALTYWVHEEETSTPSGLIPSPTNL